MADDVNNSAAESSPAASSTEILASMTSAERSEWRNTGNIPEPKTQDKAPADKPKEASSEAAQAVTEPVTDIGKAQEPKKGKSESVPYERFSEVVAERNRLRDELQNKSKVETKPEPVKDAPAAEKSADEEKLLTEEEYFAQNPDKAYGDMSITEPTSALSRKQRHPAKQRPRPKSSGNRKSRFNHSKPLGWKR